MKENVQNQVGSYGEFKSPAPGAEICPYNVKKVLILELPMF